MSKLSTAVVRTPAEGRMVAVVGDVYRFLATGEDTDGKYALWEAIVPPGGGPPPHVHSREEEGFYVLGGEITFQIGAEKVVGGLARVGVAMDGAGHILHTSPFAVISFGERDGKPARKALSDLDAAIKASGIDGGLNANIVQDLWDKWIMLCTLAATCCLMRGSSGEVFPVRRRLMTIRSSRLACPSRVARYTSVTRPRPSLAINR